MTSPSTNTVFIQCRTTQTQSGFYSQGCRQTDTQSIMELWGWGLTATHTENESQRLRHSWEHTNIGLKATWRQRFKKNTFRQYWRNNCNEKRKHSKFKKKLFFWGRFFLLHLLESSTAWNGKSLWVSWKVLHLGRTVDGQLDFVGYLYTETDRQVTRNNVWPRQSFQSYEC